MAEITEEVPLYSVVPDPNNSVTFENDGAIWLTETNPRIISSNLQAKQMNEVKDEVNIKASETKSAASLANSAVTLTEQAKTEAISAKNEANQIKQDTQAIADNIVIPTEATYNQATLDNKFNQIKIENFLNFKF